MIPVAQVKDIIFMYEVEERSQRSIAKELGISRGTVARALASRERYLGIQSKRVERAPLKMTSRVMAFIDAILEQDRRAPRKQRHTSALIWQKVVSEFGSEDAPAESTVRKYVGQARRRAPEPFVPLAFPPGESMQGDFGEVQAVVEGRRRVIRFWAERLSYSRAVCVSVFRQATQVAFFEGQRAALEFFGGVPRFHIIDNMKAAIREGVGRKAQEQKGYLAFQGYYGFHTEACNPNSGHEKGQVENLVGFVQRNWFTGLPEFASWEELEAYVARQNVAYLARRHPDRREITIGEALELERRHLRPLPAAPFPCYAEVPVSANRTSLVSFERNKYSIPTEYRLQPLLLRAYTDRVEITTGGRVIATHRRAYGRGEVRFEFSHYLTALRQKPRALPFARPFQEARLEPPLRRLYERLLEIDPDDANRRWIDLAILGQECERQVFLRAVEEALARDRLDYETVRYLCRQPASPASPAALATHSEIRVEHEPVGRYNHLLWGGAGA